MKAAAERGHPIRFGIVVPPQFLTWEQIRAFFTKADDLGFDLGFVVDHFLSDLPGWEGDRGDTFEAWTLLGALAEVTDHLTLGTYVSGITHRAPAVLAKQAVTVDHISGGRLILGVGASWHEREHAAYGLRFPPPRDRVDLFGEAMELFRRFEQEERVTFRGEHLTIEDSPFDPKPVHGHMPILVGSRGKRMMRHIVRHGDIWDLPYKLDRLPELEKRFLRACEHEGRDPDEIRWSHEDTRTEAIDDLEQRVERLAPLGFSMFLIGMRPNQTPNVLEKARTLLPRLRDRWG